MANKKVLGGPTPSIASHQESRGRSRISPQRCIPCTRGSEDPSQDAKVQLVFCTMAQESWKEAEETGVHTPEAPILCVNNCGFFGSCMTENMCSKCYRNTFKAKAVSAVLEKKAGVALSSAPLVTEINDGESASVADGKQVVEEDAPKVPSNRCLSCRKKVGLTGFKCRCGDTFCLMHRYADSHRCSFDYKQAGREQIAKQNPLVKADKITKI